MSKIISQNKKIDFSLSCIEELSFQDFLSGDLSLKLKDSNSVEELNIVSEELSGEIKQKSQQIVQDAKNEAEQILRKAQETAQEYTKEALEKGYKEGEQRAEEEAEQRFNQRFEDQINQFRGIIETFRQSYTGVIKNAEIHLVKLVLEISRKIIMREVIQDKEIVLNMVQTALSRVLESSQIIVRVHPDQLEFVEENKKKILSSLFQIQDFQLQLDPSVGIGGCVVETESGSVQARIDRQFLEIEKALTGEDKEVTVNI